MRGNGLLRQWGVTLGALRAALYPGPQTPQRLARIGCVCLCIKFAANSMYM
jgi:hypothetical protein